MLFQMIKNYCSKVNIYEVIYKIVSEKLFLRYVSFFQSQTTAVSFPLFTLGFAPFSAVCVHVNKRMMSNMTDINVFHFPLFVQTRSHSPISITRVGTCACVEDT